MATPKGTAYRSTQMRPSHFENWRRHPEVGSVQEQRRGAALVVRSHVKPKNPIGAAVVAALAADE